MITELNSSYILTRLKLVAILYGEVFLQTEMQSIISPKLHFTQKLRLNYFF